jgi:hypothetical protein
MSQHASLSPHRWRSFTLDQQLLMIASEMNRAAKLLVPEDSPHLKREYGRALQLTDLTVEVRERRTLRGELLRWRDLIAQLYQDGIGNPRAHTAALHCLLQFTLTTALQLAHLTLPEEVQERS